MLKQDRKYRRIYNTQILPEMSYYLDSSNQKKKINFELAVFTIKNINLRQWSAKPTAKNFKIDQLQKFTYPGNVVVRVNGNVTKKYDGEWIQQKCAFQKRSKL